MKTNIFLTLIAILIISLAGCERIQQIVAPDAPTSDTTSTIKIGVIQPSGLAPNFTRGFNVESVSAPAFVAAYTAMYMEPPDGPAAWGYDGMSLLALAIKNAGTLDPDAIRDTLANTTDYQGATAISHFDENRHPIKYHELYTIRNGQIELYKVVSP